MAACAHRFACAISSLQPLDLTSHPRFTFAPLHSTIATPPERRFHRQKALYPNVTFPPLFPGVSTHKTDAANARLIEEFLQANLDGPGGAGGVFLDLQAVDEAQIGSRGSWRSSNLALVPHGPLYRVRRMPPLRPGGDTGSADPHASPRRHGLELCHGWRSEADAALDAMREAWGAGPFSPSSLPSPASSLPASLPSPPSSQEASLAAGSGVAVRLGSPPLGRFAAGSWEFAAGSVFWDAHYQLGLFHLTWALDLAEGVTGAELPHLVDALAAAAALLDAVAEHALGPLSGGPAVGPAAVAAAVAAAPPAVRMLSSSRADVVKNAALAHVRLHAAVAVCVRNPDLAVSLAPAGRALVDAETAPTRAVSRAAAAAVEAFLAEQPRDRDAAVFAAARAELRALLGEATPEPGPKPKPKRKKPKAKKKAEGNGGSGTEL